MARRSLLTTEDDAQPAHQAPSPSEPVGTPRPRKRAARIHIGGYYPLDDSTVVAFQQLAVEMRKTQQEMFHEAMTDYLAKARATKAFR